MKSRAFPVIWAFSLLLVAAGCEEPGEAPDPPHTAVGPTFTDIAQTAGVTRTTASGNRAKQHILETTGTGVAVSDVNGDGHDDLYFVTAQRTDDWIAGERPLRNALYLSQGDGTFVESAEAAGVALAAWGNGAYFADYDNDGDRDLFVTQWGPNVLFRNEGDGRFVDVTEAAGVSGMADAWSSSAAFGDLDNDGDLDLYVVNYLRYDPADPPGGNAKVLWRGITVLRGPHGFQGQPDVLWRNNGDGTFTDVSEVAGFRRSSTHHYGLAVVMSDLDDDNDLDIYVANDSRSNYLWRNDGDLRFSEVSVMAGVATNEDAKEQAGMGADSGDYDGDGLPDLVVTNFSHDWNTLYSNRGALQFIDQTFPAGFRDSYLRLVWGVKFFDADNDGWLDVYVCNGHIYPEVDDHPDLNTSYAQLDTLYRNLGDGTFENFTGRAGPGLAVRASSRGLAVIDLQRDGALDLAVTHIDGRPSLLENTGAVGPWIGFRLRGVRSNRDAVGARVALTAGGRVQIREVNPYGSYLSQGTHDVHFGLGDLGPPERIEVRWPSGLVETIDVPEAGRYHEHAEGDGTPVEGGEA